MAANRNKILCGQCRNYYVTYDAKQPYGCRAYGFRSKQQPALVVLHSSGMACAFFVAKEKNKSGV